MKKKMSSLLQLVIILLGIIVPSLTSAPPIEAKEVAGVITSMSLSNHDGSALSSGYDIWQQFRINATFTLPNNTVSAGDTTKITLPIGLTFAVMNNIELKDSDDNVVANAILDEDAKTITLTYTNYAENRSNVTGNFFFYGRVDHNIIQREQDIDVTLDVQGTPIYAGRVHYNGPPVRYSSLLEKAGWQDKNDSRKMKYELSINRNMVELSNLVVTDEVLSPGLELIPDSFQVFRLDWSWNNGTWDHTNHEDITSQLNIQITPDKRRFSIDLGTLSYKGILINYDVRLPYVPVDGEIFKNRAELQSNGSFISGDIHSTTYFVAGGSAEGYVFSIDLTKTDENNQPLAGAVFEVVRDRNGAVVDRISTNDDGKAVFTKLLKDDYTIREVTAPAGYQLSSEEIKVTGDAFDSNTKTFKKTVTNKKLISIPIKKVWKDEENQDGIRPTSVTMKLLADGQEVPGKTIELTEATQWQGTFTDLPQTDASGKKITYTVTEVPVPGYKLVKTEGDATTGFTITNCHTPKKTKISFVKKWDDANDYDKVRPSEITVHLLANGERAATKIIRVDADGNWKGEFTNLDVYKNGVKIVYTIDEEVPAYYEKEISGDATSGFTIKNKHVPVDVTVTLRKTDPNGKMIAGAKIQIFKGETATGAPGEEWETVEGQEHQFTLPAGVYTFREESAPKGYKKVTDITFKVHVDHSLEILNANGNQARVEGNTFIVVDEFDESPKKVTFSKVNLGGEEIAGAEIEIYAGEKAEGTPVEKWTSEAGKSKVIDLKPGKYVFHEVTAPSGYVAVNDIVFQVHHDGTITILDVNGNTARIDPNGKFVITDQYAPTTTTTTTTTSTTVATTETTDSTEVRTETTVTSEPTTTTVEPTTTTVEPTTTTVEPTTTRVEPTTTRVEPTTTRVEPTATTVEPTATTVEPTITTVEPTTTTVEPTITTVEPTTTTIEPTTTRVEPTTTRVEPTTTTVEPTTTIVEPTTTTVEAIETTGTTPPPSGKKGKALPKTGEESGLVTTLIGIALLSLVGVASLLYRKSKKS